MTVVPTSLVGQFVAIIAFQTLLVCRCLRGSFSRIFKKDYLEGGKMASSIKSDKTFAEKGSQLIIKQFSSVGGYSYYSG